MRDLLDVRTARQRALVTKLMHRGRDYKLAEAVLLNFERTRNAFSAIRELERNRAQRLDAMWAARGMSRVCRAALADPEARIDDDDDAATAASIIREELRYLRNHLDDLSEGDVRDEIATYAVRLEALLNSIADGRDQNPKLV